MKTCINCYAENTPDAVFCSNCGMSLRGAPTGDEAVKLFEEGKTLEETRRRRIEEPLTASGIVYLFGHQFARPWDRSAKLGAARNLGGGAALAPFIGLFALLVVPPDMWWAPVRVPLSRQRVLVKDLALKLCEAAFVSLAQDGYIHLQVERREGALSSQDAVAIRRVKAGNDLPRSLERSIMEALTRPTETRWLKDVVERLRGWRAKWAMVVDIEKDALMEMGWLQRGVADKEYVHGAPTEEAARRLDAMAGEAEIVRARLTTFATANPDLHDRLLYDTEDGVRGHFSRPFWQW